MYSWRVEQLAGAKVAVVEGGGRLDNRAIARRIAQVKVLFAGRSQPIRDPQDSDDAFAVLNLSTLVERFGEWTRHLPAVHPYYAVKCNDDPLVLRVLARLGANFDCASKAEISLLLDGGVASAERILYANPCKTRSYIQHADARGVRRMTFDSAEELRKIAECHMQAEWAWGLGIG